MFQGLTAVLNSVRIGAVQAFFDETLGALILRDALDLLVSVGNTALADLLAEPDRTEKWLDWIGGYSRMVAYPVCCARVGEFLGLKALHQKQQGDAAGFAETLTLLTRIFDAQPGLRHPVADRYAASIAPPILALAVGRDTARAERWLVDTTKWVCDRHEASEAGLAGVYASAQEEVATLLGSAVEGVDVAPRKESLLAVAVTDLAHSVCPTRYPDILNEFLAVRVIPSALHGEDSVFGCFVGGGGTTALLNVKYPDQVAGGGLPHMNMQQVQRVPERIGGVAAQLALAALCRDRLFTDCYPRVRRAAGS